MLLQGLFVPLTCPFYRDGKSYIRKIEHNVRRYTLGPAAGLVALPPDGEALGLTDAEVRETLQAVAETAGKEKVLIAGIERASVPAALERIGAAVDAGFDAVLLAPPLHWNRLVHGVDGSEVLLYYKTIADASPLPVILWNDRATSSLRLPETALVDLAHTPNIIGLVDGALTPETLASLLAATADVRREVATTTIFEAVTGRMLVASAAPVALPQTLASQTLASQTLASQTLASQTLASQTLVTIGAPAGPVAVAEVLPALPTLKTRSRTVGFQVLSAGAAHGMVPLLNSGASGVLPELAACAPQGCHEVYAAWKDGDEPLAVQRAARLTLAEKLMQELGPAGVKYGCDWNGFYGGPPRLPRVAITGEQRSLVERALGEVRN